MKKLYMILMIILLAVLGYGYSIFSNLESKLHSDLEKYASKIIGTDVNLYVSELNIFEGGLVVENVKIANLKEYKAENIITVEKIYVKFSPSSLFEDVLHIKEIKLENPSFFLETLSSTQDSLVDMSKKISEENLDIGLSRKVLIDKILVGKIDVKAEDKKFVTTDISLENIENQEIQSVVKLVMKKILVEVSKVIPKKKLEPKEIVIENLRNAILDIKERVAKKGIFSKMEE